MTPAHRRATDRWLRDVLRAVDAIRRYLRRGDLDDEMVYDAVRMRTMEIGEAVKSLPDELLRTEPAIPWRELRGVRDRLAHRYFLDDVAYLRATALRDLDAVEAAVQRMLGRLRATPPDDGGPAGGV